MLSIGIKKNFNKELQICRAFAAVLVLIDHSGTAALLNTNSLIISKILGYLGSFGFYVFFVISGYIMMETSNGKHGRFYDCIEFLVRRFSRIAPIYYIGTLFACLCLSNLKNIPLKEDDILYSVLFLARWSNIENPGFFPVLGVGWTINLEMFFYALFSISLLFNRNRGSILLILCLFLLVLLGSILHKLLPLHLHHTCIFFYTEDIILQFAAGIFIYIISSKIKKIHFSILLVPSVAILLFYVIYIAYTNNIPYMQRPISILSICLVSSAVFFKWNFNYFVNRIFVFLGDASYSIYIFHTIVLLIINYIFIIIGFTDPLIKFMIFIFSALIISLICYYLFEITSRRFIERPIRNMLKK
jgi:peptidoglycan/LPS O-acetylase OafA/YrhL